MDKFPDRTHEAVRGRGRGRARGGSVYPSRQPEPSARRYYTPPPPGKLRDRKPSPSERLKCWEDLPSGSGDVSSRQRPQSADMSSKQRQNIADIISKQRPDSADMSSRHRPEPAIKKGLNHPPPGLSPRNRFDHTAISEPERHGSFMTPRPRVAERPVTSTVGVQTPGASGAGNLPYCTRFPMQRSFTGTEPRQQKSQTTQTVAPKIKKAKVVASAEPSASRDDVYRRANCEYVGISRDEKSSVEYFKQWWEEYKKNGIQCNAFEAVSQLNEAFTGFVGRENPLHFKELQQPKPDGSPRAANPLQFTRKVAIASRNAPSDRKMLGKQSVQQMIRAGSEEQKVQVRLESMAIAETASRPKAARATVQTAAGLQVVSATGTLARQVKAYPDGEANTSNPPPSQLLIRPCNSCTCGAPWTNWRCLGCFKTFDGPLIMRCPYHKIDTSKCQSCKGGQFYAADYGLEVFYDHAKFEDVSPVSFQTVPQVPQDVANLLKGRTETKQPASLTKSPDKIYSDESKPKYEEPKPGFGRPLDRRQSSGGFLGRGRGRGLRRLQESTPPGTEPTKDGKHHKPSQSIPGYASRMKCAADRSATEIAGQREKLGKAKCARSSATKVVTYQPPAATRKPGCKDMDARALGVFTGTKSQVVSAECARSLTANREAYQPPAAIPKPGSKDMDARALGVFTGAKSQVASAGAATDKLPKTGNDLTKDNGCICALLSGRPKRRWICWNCNESFVGYIKMICPVHPKQCYLHDVVTCSRCGFDGPFQSEEPNEMYIMTRYGFKTIAAKS